MPVSSRSFRTKPAASVGARFMSRPPWTRLCLVVPAKKLLYPALLGAALAARAEPGRLPVRSFDADDGLAPGAVQRIVPDSKGFLWFCTTGGLSRFDGTGFVSFGASEGLGRPPVRDVVEDTDRKTYWVGTLEGLYRLDGDRPPSTGRLFERVPLPVDAGVTRLLQDRRGRLWVGTMDGLVVLERGPLGDRSWRVPTGEEAGRELSPIYALLEDTDGSVWAGTQGDGLLRVAPDGRGARRFPGTIRGLSFIRDLLRGPDDRIWCAFLGGVARLRAQPDVGDDPVEDIFDAAAGLLSGDTSGLLVGDSGEMLVATTAGVFELRRDAAERWRILRNSASRDRLADELVNSIARDPAGNLWLGTPTRGARKLVRAGFRGYPEIEENASVIKGFFEDDGGGMVVLAAVEQRRYRLHRIADDGHVALDVRLPGGISYLGWGGSRLLRDRDDHWWLTTGEGLVEYRGSHDGARRLGRPHDRRLGLAEGLPGLDLYAAFEDSRGALWVSVSQPHDGLGSVARREPGGERFEAWPATATPVPGDLATKFLDDRSGTVWIGFMSGHLMRVRGATRAEPVVFDPPLADGPCEPLGFDSHGRLWITAGAVHVVDDPSAPTLRARPAPADLSDTAARCMVEDGTGRLYFGTTNGVLRLDEQRGTLRRFTRADGLPGNDVSGCARARNGDLWFSDLVGLARFTPGAEPELPAPEVRIAAVRVDGAALPIPPLGALSVSPVALAAGPHHVSVDYFAISHSPGARVLYQHGMEGGSVVWSTPSPTRTLEFPRLGPGRHRLMLRAVPEHGDPVAPAVLALVIPAPVWQRGWFLALSATLVLGSVYAAYRLRVARLLALERVRTRIATDLHDEVGADLSRISLLADFVQRDLDTHPARTRSMLEEVAGTARGAVRDMSDIVWALKPRRADLSQVVARVRDFAAEIAAPAGIALSVTAAADLERVSLGGELGRELYLLLKEAVSNAIRHAGARSLVLEVHRVGRGIIAELRDDGRGFDPEAPAPSRGGHGLANMSARARRLGGVLSIDSTPGRGTNVRITLPKV